MVTCDSKAVHKKWIKTTMDYICIELYTDHLIKHFIQIMSTTAWEQILNDWIWSQQLKFSLTHWGRVTHMCVSDLTSIGSDNGLSSGRHQAIIRTNAGILLIRALGTNFSEFLVEILIFSFKKMRLKVSSTKRRPFCLGLNELTFLL